MIISIASGKGGTGKTSLAVNLALSLPGQIQLLDCDVDEPNVHTLLSMKNEQVKPVYTLVPEIDEQKCNQSKNCVNFCPNHAIFVGKKGINFFPELCYGCGGCILSCPNQAIKEGKRQLGVTHSGVANHSVEVVYGNLNIGEPLAVPVIKAVKEQASPNNEVTVIIDCPPGVSCPMVESVHGSDYCVLVTEPTPFGLHDLQLAVDTIRQLKIPIGVVVNRSGIGDRQVYSYCKSEQIPILLEIPHSRKIAELFAEGIPFVTKMPEWKSQFETLFQMIQERYGR
ncbi:MAG: ATP-binding protein [Candidatus Hermodarchaeota archaeon]|nr:ATP-binding protein [Candidatus Hermodarchaeota archaeon]